ncbi:MAG TPA: opioid growth factor receptor-related protein [Gemmatimonadaceae bacterium]|nr:opioid growth factor receptor-related protein [Gemmatimonadaceae bacterium]
MNYTDGARGRESDCQRILAFYRGEGRDDRGRTFEEVLDFDDEELEETHDYIQWLFPLAVPSGVQPWAPLVDRECQERFRADPELGNALRRALERMLEFYGLRIVPKGGDVAIQRSENFARRAEVWLTQGNHNFLRLTRMMASLSLLGQQEVAAALQTCLKDIYRDFGETIGVRTLGYWSNAIASTR